MHTGGLSRIQLDPAQAEALFMSILWASTRKFTPIFPHTHLSLDFLLEPTCPFRPRFKLGLNFDLVLTVEELALLVQAVESTVLYFGLDTTQAR